MSHRILVVDDDQSMCELIHDALSQKGYRVDWCTSGDRALEVLHDTDYDIVIADVRLGGMTGLELCERIASNRPDLPVLVMTGFGNLETAIAAIRVGAYDFITKPVDLSALELAVRRAVRHRELQDEVKRLRQRVEEAQSVEEIIGISDGMRHVFDLIQRVSEADTSVLITGESGTGKELVAAAIHRRSSRRDGPFIAINCAAMPATLLESELFGHTKGAFTDAKTSRQGLFVQATGGTLFLDEIGEMPVEMQAKLLRVLQDRKVRPIGSNQEIPFDTRIISATNRDIEARVDEGQFREDLFYRINVVRIHVPPLRGRGRDVLLLAQHFVDRHARTQGKAVEGISSQAAQKLLDYEWPGNVRELENCIERAVTLTRYEHITVDDLPDKIRDYQATHLIIGSDDPEELPTLEEVERRYIRRVLRAVGGNKTQAARIIGVDRRTLYRRLERFDEREREA